jgi:hypothetical protein
MDIANKIRKIEALIAGAKSDGNFKPGRELFLEKSPFPA